VRGDKLSRVFPNTDFSLRPSRRAAHLIAALLTLLLATDPPQLNI
jgi:hypothetical protein